MPQGGAGKQTEDGQRGSERMLRERELPEKQIQQLLSLSQRNARLVYWFPKGQPVPAGTRSRGSRAASRRCTGRSARRSRTRRRAA